jgi:hypothetical protein
MYVGAANPINCDSGLRIVMASPFEPTVGRPVEAQSDSLSRLARQSLFHGSTRVWHRDENRTSDMSYITLESPDAVL